MSSSRAPERDIHVFVDDRRVRIPAGITVAAALLNLDVWSFRTSTSGESRGPVCGMGVCAECRVTIDDAPHQRACTIAVADGMRIRTAAST
jgi:D-hydroxyproline dehydrogenase subunit gamma